MHVFWNFLVWKCQLQCKQSCLNTLRASPQYIRTSILVAQHPSSSADCARELFKGPNGSASLVDCTRKKIFGWGCGFFVTDVISEVVLGSFLAHVAWPRAQPLGQSVSLKFSLETRLESKSFGPLIDFVAFLVQKL